MLQADLGLDWRAESTSERLGELLFLWVSHGRVLGDRLVRAKPSHPASPATQSAALSSGERRGVVYASQTAGVGLSGASVRVGKCACLRREVSGEPDAGHPHLRFDEGRVGRGFVAFSPTLPMLGIANVPRARKLIAFLTVLATA